MLRHSEFLRFNDLPVIMGGTGPSEEMDDAAVHDAMIEWLGTPVQQLYIELNRLFRNAHRVPNMTGWVAFYDDLIKHKR
jgi:hypothetical protein